jgi:hypothetical protein
MNTAEFCYWFLIAFAPLFCCFCLAEWLVVASRRRSAVVLVFLLYTGLSAFWVPLVLPSATTRSLSTDAGLIWGASTAAVLLTGWLAVSVRRRLRTIRENKPAFPVCFPAEDDDIKNRDSS